MALYNFQRRFKPMILSGRKRHTIRAKRKRQTRPGETLHLYCGLRTKSTDLLMRPTCTRVDEISIPDERTVLINDEPLDKSEKDSLAYADGFENFAEMIRFWDGRLPFDGDLIHWTPNSRPQGESRSAEARTMSAPVSTSRMHAPREESKGTVLQQRMLHEGLSRETSTQVTGAMPTLWKIAPKKRASA